MHSTHRMPAAAMATATLHMESYLPIQAALRAGQAAAASVAAAVPTAAAAVGGTGMGGAASWRRCSASRSRCLRSGAARGRRSSCGNNSRGGGRGGGRSGAGVGVGVLGRGRGRDTSSDKGSVEPVMTDEGSSSWVLRPSARGCERTVVDPTPATCFVAVLMLMAASSMLAMHALCIPPFAAATTSMGQSALWESGINVNRNAGCRCGRLAVLCPLWYFGCDGICHDIKHVLSMQVQRVQVARSILLICNQS